jgi:Tudor domain
VRISHIENGAKLFYVQVKNQLDMITELSKRMEQVPLQQPDFLQEGSVYLVKQGNVVCRGLLVSADPFRARLIDFGNIVNTDYKDLWELPTPYDKVGQMAFRFSLAGFYSNLKLSFNSEAAEKFQSLVRVADEFQLKVVAADGPPSSQYCELYKNNASLLNILVEELSKPINYERQSLQANFEYEVFVSFIDTTSKALPWTFYVQMASEKSRLDALSTEMMLVCGGSSAPANADQLAENAPVLAKYMGEWYRGQLLQKGSQNCAVYFVDYGNTDEQVPLNNLRMPTRSVVKQMPEQAFKCVLDGCSSNLKARDIMEQVLEDKVSLLLIICGSLW